MIIPKEALHQTLAIIPVSYNEFSMGIANGWLAPTLKKLQNPNSELPLTTEQSSWIGSLHEFGRFCGPILSLFILDKIGRKPVLLLSAIIFCLIWILMLFSKSVLILYLVRFGLGISIGMSDATSAIYLGENCSPRFRGIFSSITLLTFFFAITIEFFLASYFSYTTTIIINLILAFFGILLILLAKETPYFLISKEKFQNAGRTLSWLKGNKLWNDVNNEFEEMKRHVAEEKSKQSLQEIFSSPINYKSVILGIILNLFYMCSGYATIVAFAALIFVPSKNQSSYDFTVYYGICQSIAVAASIFVIERFNRRTLVLLSFASFLILHSCTVVLLYFKGNLSSKNYYPWLLFFTITAYGSIYSFVYPVVHIIRGELFPQSIKVIGGCLAIMAHSGMGFITAKLFLIIAESYGMHYNFLLFAIVSLFAVICTYFTLPETRGKTLVEIYESYKK